MDFPPVAVAGAIGAALGAAVFDTITHIGGWRFARGSAVPSILAAGMAALVWSGQFAGLAVVDAVRRPASLWVGVVVLAAFSAAALGLLAAPATDEVVTQSNTDTALRGRGSGRVGG